MYTKLILYLTLALIASFTQAQGSASNDNCQCRVGSLGGKYCGYCLEVESCQTKGPDHPCRTNVYICNRAGGCAKYGFLEDCTKPENLSTHCGPAGPSPFSTTKTSGSHPSTLTPGSGQSSPASAHNGGNLHNNSSGGLSTGAKAGIGVGVAVGVCLIVGAIAFVMIRRRHAQKAEMEKAKTPEFAPDKKDDRPEAVEADPTPVEKPPNYEVDTPTTATATIVGSPEEPPVHPVYRDHKPVVSELNPQHGRSELP